MFVFAIRYVSSSMSALSLALARVSSLARRPATAGIFVARMPTSAPAMANLASALASADAASGSSSPHTVASSTSAAVFASTGSFAGGVTPMRANGDVPIACSSRARCSSRSRACPRGELVEESVGSSATSRDSSRLRGGGSWRGAAWPRGLLRTAAAPVRGETVADTSSCAGTTARFFAWPEAVSGSVVAFLFFTPSRVVVVVVVVAWTAADDGEDLHGRFVRPSATRGAGTVAEDHRLDGVEGVGAATGGAAARRSRRGRLRGGRRHGSVGQAVGYHWTSFSQVFITVSSEGKVSRRPRSTQPVASSEKKFNSGESLRGARREDDDVWRPDLERIRAEIAAEAELELEVKVEASDVMRRSRARSGREPLEQRGRANTG